MTKSKNSEFSNKEEVLKSPNSDIFNPYIAMTNTNELINILIVLLLTL